MLGTVALHWATYFSHKHGHMPALAMRPSDDSALSDIVFAQCHGNLDRALTLIEELVCAQVPGTSIAARWAAYVWWVEAGEPRRYRAPKRHSARTVGACIALNAKRRAA